MNRSAIGIALMIGLSSLAGCATPNGVANCSPAPMAPAADQKPAGDPDFEVPLASARTVMPEVLSAQGDQLTYVKRISPLTATMSAAAIEKAKQFGAFEELQNNLKPELAQVWVGTVITRSADKCIATISSLPKDWKAPGEPAMNIVQQSVICPAVSNTKA